MHFRKLELEDQPWFPETIKESMTDYLRFIFNTFNLYKPVIPLLNKALKLTGKSQIIDLCSGSGGAMESIVIGYKRMYSEEIKVVLTDISPKIHAYKHISARLSNISFVEFPVNAANVPNTLDGLRTIFSGIHHFDPVQVKAILKNASDSQQGIAIFDGGNKSVLMVLLILVFHPVTLFITTPFIRPFRWSRIIFTYIIPLILVGVVWDGIISILNLYKPSALLSLAKGIPYYFETGRVKNQLGLSITYLVGTPKKGSFSLKV